MDAIASNAGGRVERLVGGSSLAVHWRFRFTEGVHRKCSLKVLIGDAHWRCSLKVLVVHEGELNAEERGRSVKVAEGAAGSGIRKRVTSWMRLLEVD